MEINSEVIINYLGLNNEANDLSKNVTVQIRTELYDKMLAKSRLAPNKQDKTLEPGALHDYLSKELSAFLSKFSINIQS